MDYIYFDEFHEFGPDEWNKLVDLMGALFPNARGFTGLLENSDVEIRTDDHNHNASQTPSDRRPTDDAAG